MRFQNLPKSTLLYNYKRFWATLRYFLGFWKNEFTHQNSFRYDILKGNMIFSVRVSSVNLCNGFWLLVDEQAYAMISSNEIDPKEIKLQVASWKYYIVNECTLWRCLAKKYRRNQKVLVLGKSANISQNRRYCWNINDF